MTATTSGGSLTERSRDNQTPPGLPLSMAGGVIPGS
jgi:hypothetical protein